MCPACLWWHGGRRPFVAACTTQGPADARENNRWIYHFVHCSQFCPWLCWSFRGKYQIKPWWKQTATDLWLQFLIKFFFCSCSLTCNTLGSMVNLEESNKCRFALLMGNSPFWPGERSLIVSLLEADRVRGAGLPTTPAKSQRVSQVAGDRPLTLTQLQLKVFQLGLTFGNKWVMTRSLYVTSAQVMDIPLCPTDVLCAKILGKERQPWLVLLSNEKHFWVLIACLPIQGKAQLQGSSEDTCRAAVHAAFILGFSFAHFLYTLQEEKKSKSRARLHPESSSQQPE